MTLDLFSWPVQGKTQADCIAESGADYPNPRRHNEDCGLRAPSVARPASEAAADAADRPAGRAKRLTDAMTILRCLVAYPEGLTRGELEQMTGLSGNTVRPRLCYDLYGLVEESEETREVAGHRAAHVVRATEQGREAVR